MRPLFIVVRIAGALAIIAAVVGQLQLSLQVWAGLGITDPSVQLANFFSFFTIDSNVLSVVVLAIGAVLLIRNVPDSRGFAVFRGSVTAYMAVTGIVYNLLLRGIELPQGTTLPWSNEVLHVVGPILMVVDWLFAPGRTPLVWRNLWVIVSFPLVWAIYTMIRGPLVVDAVSGNDFWYPYPFLNPNISPNGYLSVAFYVLLIALIIGVVGAGVIWVSRKGRRWPLRATDG